MLTCGQWHTTRCVRPDKAWQDHWVEACLTEAVWQMLAPQNLLPGVGASDLWYKLMPLRFRRNKFPSLWGQPRLLWPPVQGGTCTQTENTPQSSPSLFWFTEIVKKEGELKGKQFCNQNNILLWKFMPLCLVNFTLNLLPSIKSGWVSKASPSLATLYGFESRFHDGKYQTDLEVKNGVL